MKIAFIMPGQGSQSIGMGKSLYDNFSCAKEVFEEVDEALGENLSRLMFSGEAEELTLTYNAQPAIMAVSMAVIRVLESMGLNIAEHIRIMAGHSLGEYSALCAAGVYSLADTARLLRLRGRAMQEAVPKNTGAMCAVIGSDLAQLEDICRQVSGDGVCEIANDNGGGQIVLSGMAETLEKAAQLAKEAGAKRVVFLPVSAPFHCSLMQEAAKKMEEALSTIQPQRPCVPILPNISVVEQKEEAEIPRLLVQQVVGRVRWRETIEWMLEHEITHFYEIGWGKILTNLVKRIDKTAKAEPVYEIAELEQAINTIQDKGL